MQPVTKIAVENLMNAVNLVSEIIVPLCEAVLNVALDGRSYHVWYIPKKRRIAQHACDIHKILLPVIVSL